MEFCENAWNGVVTLPDGTEVHHDPSEKSFRVGTDILREKATEGYRVI